MKLPKILYRAARIDEPDIKGRDDLITGVREVKPWYGYGMYATPRRNIAKYYQRTHPISVIKSYELKPNANIVPYKERIPQIKGSVRDYVEYESRMLLKDKLRNEYFPKKKYTQIGYDFKFGRRPERIGDYVLKSYLEDYSRSEVTKRLRDNYGIDGWHWQDTSAITGPGTEVQEFVIINPDVLTKRRTSAKYKTPLKSYSPSLVEKDSLSLDINGKLRILNGLKGALLKGDPVVKIPHKEFSNLQYKFQL